MAHSAHGTIGASVVAKNDFISRNDIFNGTADLENFACA